ncbi:MAG: Asp-tRNA(Asn)/Glu-tRNA(Gln) amidotransferase subunit GatA [Mariniblastus sp.]|nr:Asp-tRNA(Asn)/Glu-tRNA(Gln) amidotransferase subunit GatA [Mariniblastus sp.]
MDFSNLTATQCVNQFASGEVTATALVQSCLHQIQQNDPSLNSFIRTSDSALPIAQALDIKRAAGKPLGPLAGLPIAIKDGICTAGLKTTAGSRMLEEFVPVDDATTVKRLVEADAIVIGKTNMDEFAMGSSTEHSHFGISKNPWNHQYVPGGSSGGSASCVAAGLTPASIGSDTGGSIRQPASFCGVTGLKPTYGRVSRFGLIAFASSLDQIGPMARSAEDCALITSVISGHDPKDSTSAKNDIPDFLATLNQPLKGLRIGICKQHFEEGLDSEINDSVKAAIQVLKNLGAVITEISMPHTPYAVAAYYVIAPCEASSNLARFDGVRYTHRTEGVKDLAEMYCQTRAEGFGNEVKKRIMLGTYALSSGYYDAYYLKASKVRRMIKQDYDTAFESVDLILGPTTPTPAFQIGEHSQNPLAMYLADIYTVSANLSGVPAISIPCGISNRGLPIGLQLQARSFDEATLLQTAHQFQMETDWHTRRPNQ